MIEHLFNVGLFLIIVCSCVWLVRDHREDKRRPACYRHRVTTVRNPHCGRHQMGPLSDYQMSRRWVEEQQRGGPHAERHDHT